MLTFAPDATTAAAPQNESQFLALPTEIRQKILLITMTDEDLVLETTQKYRGKSRKDDGYKTYWVVRKWDVEFHAINFSLVHPTVMDEMIYVVEVWLKRGDELLSERPCVWTDLEGEVLSCNAKSSSTYPVAFIGI